MAAAARISLHIHKLVSKKGHWFLKKAKILPKLFESLVNIVTSFVWLRLYWLRLRRRKPLVFVYGNVSLFISKSVKPFTFKNADVDPRHKYRYFQQPLKGVFSHLSLSQ